jgi:hypothetical protein
MTWASGKVGVAARIERPFSPVGGWAGEGLVGQRMATAAATTAAVRPTKRYVRRMKKPPVRVD